MKYEYDYFYYDKLKILFDNKYGFKMCIYLGNNDRYLHAAISLYKNEINKIYKNRYKLTISEYYICI